MKLPNGFKTSATFSLYDSNTEVKYFTFIDQKPESDNPNLFTRTYVTNLFSNGTKELFPKQSEDIIFNNTVRGMKGKIIATMGQWSDRPTSRHIILYSTENVIEYCDRFWNRSKANDKQSKIEMIANALKETVS